MESIKNRLADLNWDGIRNDLHDKGYAIVQQVLNDEACQELIENYSTAGRYRKTIVMERYRFGSGEYKYFSYPLPAMLQELRENVYTHIAPVANQWMREAGMEKQFPATHAEMILECQKNNQVYPTPLILKYGKGGFNALHQDLYGDVYFPIQVLFLLNQSGKDFTGRRIRDHGTDPPRTIEGECAVPG